MDKEKLGIQKLQGQKWFHLSNDMEYFQKRAKAQWTNQWVLDGSNWKRYNLVYGGVVAGSEFPCKDEPKFVAQLKDPFIWIGEGHPPNKFSYDGETYHVMDIILDKLKHYDLEEEIKRYADVPEKMGDELKRRRKLMSDDYADTRDFFRGTMNDPKSLGSDFDGDVMDIVSIQGGRSFRRQDLVEHLKEMYLPKMNFDAIPFSIEEMKAGVEPSSIDYYNRMMDEINSVYSRTPIAAPAELKQIFTDVEYPLSESEINNLPKDYYESLLDGDIIRFVEDGKNVTLQLKDGRIYKNVK